MIQRRKDGAFASCDFPIGRFHAGDNRHVIFQNMAIAIDNFCAQSSVHQNTSCGTRHSLSGQEVMFDLL
jgi:hypothetical protein